MKRVLVLVALFCSLSSLAAETATKSKKATKPKSQRCQLTWHLMSEGPLKKKITLKNKAEVKLTKRLIASISNEGNDSSVEIKEVYKDDPKNFTQSKFSCDRFLNCKGFRKQQYNGKIEEQPLTMAPTGSIGMGKIGNREIFSYQPKPKGFDYQYIVYRNPKDQPMGLKVSCNE